MMSVKVYNWTQCWRHNTSQFDWTQHTTNSSSISWGDLLAPGTMNEKPSNASSLDLGSWTLFFQTSYLETSMKNLLC